MMKLRLFVFVILILSIKLNAQVFDMVVAQDGSGDYPTLTSALGRALPDNRSTRFLVFIKNGVYNEKIYLESTKTNISLIGENVDSVIITWNDYSGKDGMSTAESYTFLAAGNDLYAENITFRNSAGNVGQAVAMRTVGERQVFKNCKFLGFQDTYYAHKNRQYNLYCYVEGGTDFIFGDATVVYENCTINCVKGGQYITAPSDTKLLSTTPEGTFYHGILFRNSYIKAGEGVGANSYYLMRPWQPNGSVVFVNSTMEDHIKKEGWSIWSGTSNHLSGYYAEYKSVDTEGTLIDTSERVDWSHQLTDDQVTNYYNLAYFLKKDGIVWDPVPITEALATPSGISADGKVLSWNEVEGAKGYVIYRDNRSVGFSEVNSFTDDIDVSGNYEYSIKSVNSNGNLSDASSGILITDVKSLEVSDFQISLIGKHIKTNEISDIKIFSITGSLIFDVNDVFEISLEHFNQGVYIVTAENINGKKILKKITL